MRASRRGWLEGRRIHARAVLPPPFATASFTQSCDGCGDCVQACPNGIIKLAEDGRAQLDFAEQGCSFCGDCGRACPTDALSPERSDWPYKARIGGSCLALSGVLCDLCQEACEPRAITMRPVIGGRRVPILDHDTCTGCGDCLARCPQAAIRLSPSEEFVS